MSVLLGLTCAALAGPTASVSAVGAIGDEPGGVAPWAGVGAGLDYRVWPRFDLGAAALGGASAVGDPVIGAAPHLRWYVGAPDATVLSLVVGAGAQWERSILPRVSAGAALDLRTDGPIRPRIESRYVSTPGGAPVRLELALGIRWAEVSREPQPVVEAEPVPLEPVPLEPAPTRVSTVDAMVWVPSPVCAWLEPEPANQAFVDNELRLAEVFQLGAAEVGRESPVTSSTEPMGSLIVAGWPGDRVTLGEETVEVDARGVAVLELPEGDLDIEVVGGGRRFRQEVALAPDHALWVSAPAPQDARVSFAVNSTALSSLAREQLDALVQLAADTTFVVVGAASPEGDVDANQVLATGRAQVVVDYLQAQGLDPARLTVAGSEAPDPELPLNEQRYAELRPMLGVDP